MSRVAVRTHSEPPLAKHETAESVSTQDFGRTGLKSEEFQEDKESAFSVDSAVSKSPRGIHPYRKTRRIVQRIRLNIQ